MDQRVLFQRHIARLERKLQHCEAISRTYSGVRLGVFLVGAAGCLATATFISTRAGWISLGMVAILFLAIAILHRRVDGWSSSFRIWLAMYREKLARLGLDWEHIPLPEIPVEASLSILALDLDLIGARSLHHLIDITISRQGSRLLAGWLTDGVPDPLEIASRQTLVRELAGLPRFRDRLRLIFRKLNRGPLDGNKLLEWLQVPYPEKRLRQVLPWATVLAFSNVLLFVLYSANILPPLWILTSVAYAVVYFSNQSLTGSFLGAVFDLDGELVKFQPLLRFLEGFPYRSRQALQQECSPFLAEKDRPSRRLRQLKLVAAMAGLRMNPAMGVILNILSPWDFWAARLASAQRQRMANLLPGWLETFRHLEALVSLGEFGALNPGYAYPEILPLDSNRQTALNNSATVFNVRGMGHPLIPYDRKVCNDLTIDSLGELFIITGSNMAGKSTFIRTVGINLSLAYAGAPVNAAELHTLPFRLYTCIRVSDSLGDGFSYFYAEVKRLKGLLDALHSDPSRRPLLYLVDEIFRGTNNRERLIGSRAYVRALIGAAGVGLIATHDLDLASLADANPQAHNVHFRDEVLDGKLTFDYLLRPGPSPTTNALKIMQIEGLPVDG